MKYNPPTILVNGGLLLKYYILFNVHRIIQKTMNGVNQEITPSMLQVFFSANFMHHLLTRTITCKHLSSHILHYHSFTSVVPLTVNTLLQ